MSELATPDSHSAKPKQAHIRFENMSKAFKGTKGQTQNIFTNFNLSIQKHEFVSILGPSGCGKSTLLRLLSGLMPYDSGDVFVHKQRISAPFDDVSFVFQKPTLLPWLSAKDNILFPLKHKYGRVNKKERAKADQLLELIDLPEHGNKRPNQLSGGMQQRIGIARALIQDSEILLMDEPFSALDAMSREKLGFELLNLLEPKPKTVLFVTHSIPEAVLLSDKVLVLDANPASVLDFIPIHFDEKRSLNTLSDPKFGKYCTQIRNYFYKNEDSQKSA